MSAAWTGITHYAWPGGLAVVIQTPASPAAAVFGPGGWRHGPPHAVFAEGPPPVAETFQLALPQAFTDQLVSLEVAGGLHTDFVHLERLVGHLQSERKDAAVVVLGRVPAALVVSDGELAVVEPDPEVGVPVDAVLKYAAGWIVVVQGKVVPPVPAAVAAPQQVEPAPDRRADEPEPDRPAVVAEPFGRFAADARFLLSPGAVTRLPAEVAAEMSAATGDAGPAVMALFDGAHALSEIASATGLTPEQVATVVETLVAHRLAFRYMSRVRPPTGASTPG